MYGEKKFLAVIPARGGSKRLPGKNVKKICNKPMIAWSIEAAKNSKYIDVVSVSSDDEQALLLAFKYDVISIIRPDYLASDTAKTVDVINHALEEINDEFDYLILLQPTSPLRTSAHVDEAIEKIFEYKTDSIVSVCECEHSPMWANTLPINGSMKCFMDQNLNDVRSQDLEAYYRLNGAIYIVNINEFRKNNCLLMDSSFAYIMNVEDSIDIDTKFDFLCAEALLTYRLLKV